MSSNNSKSDKVVTQSYLDKRTEEIVDVVKDLFQIQNNKLDEIQEDLGIIRKEQVTHSIMLDSHEVKIEKLEKITN